MSLATIIKQAIKVITSPADSQSGANVSNWGLLS